MTKRIGIVAVFLVGCAVGGGASAFVVPKASAQQAATLPQWEYKCPMFEREQMEADANRLGRERWELAVEVPGTSVSEPRWCFKRPRM